MLLLISSGRCIMLLKADVINRILVGSETVKPLTNSASFSLALALMLR